MHKNEYIHRSIRASHILINKTKAVLCGFRECTSLLNHGERTRTLHNLPPNNPKALNWLAPEVLEQNLLGYTEKSDVYSVGITICELANGIEPFADMPTTFMFTEKVRGNQPTLLDNSTCPPEEMIAQSGEAMGDSFAMQTRQIYSQRRFSDLFHKFTEKCLQRFPDERPNVSHLLMHSFFKQIKHTTLQEQFFLYGMDNVDLTRLRGWFFNYEINVFFNINYYYFTEDDVKLTCDFGDLNIGSGFEWDF